MTARVSPPNVAQELLRIHRAITRGLTVGVTKGLEFEQSGFPNPRIRQGYSDYAQSLMITLSAHHLAEDDIAFPLAKERLPNTPIDRLSANHKEIETLLEPGKELIVRLAAGAARLT